MVKEGKCGKFLKAEKILICICMWSPQIPHKAQIYKSKAWFERKPVDKACCSPGDFGLLMESGPYRVFVALLECLNTLTESHQWPLTSSFSWQYIFTFCVCVNLCVKFASRLRACTTRVLSSMRSCLPLLFTERMFGSQGERSRLTGCVAGGCWE